MTLELESGLDIEDNDDPWGYFEAKYYYSVSMSGMSDRSEMWALIEELAEGLNNQKKETENFRLDDFKGCIDDYEKYRKSFVFNLHTDKEQDDLLLDMSYFNGGVSHLYIEKYFMKEPKVSFLEMFDGDFIKDVITVTGDMFSEAVIEAEGGLNNGLDVLFAYNDYRDEMIRAPETSSV